MAKAMIRDGTIIRDMEVSSRDMEASSRDTAASRAGMAASRAAMAMAATKCVGRLIAVCGEWGVLGWLVRLWEGRETMRVPA